MVESFVVILVWFDAEASPPPPLPVVRIRSPPVLSHWSTHAAPSVTFVLAALSFLTAIASALATTAADFAQFSRSHAGAGGHSVLEAPKFRGLPLEAGGAVDIEAVTKGGLEVGSKLIGAGAKVTWSHDFNGVPTPSSAVDSGPFQSS